MALLKKLKNSRKKSSDLVKAPSKKRGPYKPRATRTPLAKALKERIAEKTEAILDSTSSPETPLINAPAPDSDLEKLRKEKDLLDKQKEYDLKSYSKKKGGKKGKQPRPAPTKEGVLALLRLPFQIGGAITGYSADPIHPAVAEPLAESTLVVLQDFGFEALQKWINLGVFAALYGTCGFGWFQGLQKWAKEQQRAALAAKKGKIHDIIPPTSADPAKAV